MTAFILPLAATGVLFGMIAPRFAKPKKKPQARKDREMRDHMSEKEIDKMLKDSFPASDPPSTY